MEPERKAQGLMDLHVAVGEIAARQNASGQAPANIMDSHNWVKLSAVRDALQAKGYSREEQNMLITNGRDAQVGNRAVDMGKYHHPAGILKEDDLKASLKAGGETQHYAFLRTVHGPPAASSAPAAPGSVAHAQSVESALKSVSSVNDANDLMAKMKLSRAQLKSLASDLGVPVAANSSIPVMIKAIVYQKVAFRLASKAIEGTGGR